jgi:CMP-N-acetylneuraminic acid synthetase
MPDPHVVALLPMRHDSERVKGKNYRPLAGRPLYHHIVETLIACPRICEVVIDTDSDLIAADAQDAFADVRIIMRPDHIRGGEVDMNVVLRNDVAQVPADLYVQTHSTNPLLRVETVTDAIDAYLANRDRHDSLFTVTALQTRLYSADGEALNHDPAVLLRTQDLAPVMEENSCLYVFTAQTLRESGARIGATPLLFAIDREEAWDIDEEIDWKIVEALYAAEHV